MGICNVMAVVPFLCAGAPEEPEHDEEQEQEQVGHVIEAQPAPEVGMTVLESPSDATVRNITEYEVLPPATGYRDTITPEEAAAENATVAQTQSPSTFGEWVGANYTDEPTEPTLADRNQEPPARATTTPSVVATSTPTIQPLPAPARREPVAVATTTPDPLRAAPIRRTPVTTTPTITPTPEPVIVTPTPAPVTVTQAPAPAPAPVTVRQEPVVAATAVPQPTVTTTLHEPDMMQVNDVDLATLDRPVQVVPQVQPQPTVQTQTAMIVTEPVAVPAPIEETQPQPMPQVQRTSMNLTPRVTSMSAIKQEEMAEGVATQVVFTEAEPFVERGAAIAAEGVAQRKRQQFRRVLREYQREQRRSGQDG